MMVSGCGLYEAHRWAAEALGIFEPPWEDLAVPQRTEWLLMAHDQNLRDRPEPATLRSHERT